MSKVANPFALLLKLNDKAPPMSVLMPSVVKKLQGLIVGQGLELPYTTRRTCHWSHDINAFARRGKIPLQVSQTTTAGVTTAWRVK